MTQLNLDDLSQSLSADQLREWRIRLKLDQKAAAHILGMSQRGYRNYEIGFREVPFGLKLSCIAYESWPELRRMIPTIIAAHMARSDDY